MATSMSGVLADVTADLMRLETYGLICTVIATAVSVVGLVFQVIAIFQTAKQTRVFMLQAGGQMVFPPNPSRGFNFIPIISVLISAVMTGLIWAAVLYSKGNAYGSILMIVLLGIIFALVLSALFFVRSKMPENQLATLKADPQLRIVYPTVHDQISTEKIVVRGTCAFRPTGKWMLWTRIDLTYWSQKNLVFGIDGKSWTSQVSISSPNPTTILVTEITPEIEYIVGLNNELNQLKKESGKRAWMGIKFPQQLDGIRVVDEVTVQKLVSSASAASMPKSIPQIDPEIDQRVKSALDSEFISNGEREIVREMANSDLPITQMHAHVQMSKAGAITLEPLKPLANKIPWLEFDPSTATCKIYPEYISAVRDYFVNHPVPPKRP